MSSVVCGAAGGFDRAAQGLLGAGRRLADSLGGKLRAVVVGPADEPLSTAPQAVADTVAVVEDALLAEYHPENYLDGLADGLQAALAAAVLLGNDTYSQELAAAAGPSPGRQRRGRRRRRVRPRAASCA